MEPTNNTDSTTKNHGQPPRRSPWGAVQDCKERAPGIWEIGTSSHGGFKLSCARNAAMPEQFRRESGWYEEDCEWALVAYVYGWAFSDAERCAAAQRIFNDYPDEYTSLTGNELTLEQSRTLRERAAKDATRDMFVVFSARSDGPMIEAHARKASTGHEIVVRLAASEYTTLWHADWRCHVIPDAFASE